MGWSPSLPPFPAPGGTLHPAQPRHAAGHGCPSHGSWAEDRAGQEQGLWKWGALGAALPAAVTQGQGTGLNVPPGTALPRDKSRSPRQCWGPGCMFWDGKFPLTGCKPRCAACPHGQRANLSPVCSMAITMGFSGSPLPEEGERSPALSLTSPGTQVQQPRAHLEHRGAQKIWPLSQDH